MKEVACKVHQLNISWTEQAKQNYIKHVEREVETHKELNHPNIARLLDIADIDRDTFATILEYCDGPDLSTYMRKFKNIAEKDARVFIKQVLSALKYMNVHNRKVIHYDLKPQNLIFHKGEIKILDFGLCKIINDDESKIELTSQGVGTYWYLPPECFKTTDIPMISNKVDVWSVGIIFFEMLYGVKPFGNNMSQDRILREQIILKSYNVAFPIKPTISNQAKEFIRKCLTYNEPDRLDVEQAFSHPYLSKINKS